MINAVAVHVQVFHHGIAFPGRVTRASNVLQGAFLLGRSLISSEV